MIIVKQTILKIKHNKNSLAHVLRSIFGIGTSRAVEIAITVAGRRDVKINQLKDYHYRQLTRICNRNQYMCNDLLKGVRQKNIRRLKKLNCYRGIRLLKGLPIHGRTRSNAITARFLGLGTFEYIPKRPTNVLRRISSYIRRKSHLKTLSEVRYRKLLAKNYAAFQQNHTRLSGYLRKKNQLGVFAKLDRAIKKKAKQDKKKFNVKY